MEKNNSVHIIIGIIISGFIGAYIAINADNNTKKAQNINLHKALLSEMQYDLEQAYAAEQNRIAARYERKEWDGFIISNTYNSMPADLIKQLDSVYASIDAQNRGKGPQNITQSKLIENALNEYKKYLVAKKTIDN